jgi:hypothetical protein
MKIPSTKNQNSKFKTDAMVVKHLLSDRNDPVIGISNMNIACPVKKAIWNLRYQQIM